MYIDLVLLFLIYSFSAIALGISIYALWTLKEVEEQFNNKVRSLKGREKHLSKPPITVPRERGHWD
jgi:hypothetical protein